MREALPHEWPAADARKRRASDALFDGPGHGQYRRIPVGLIDAPSWSPRQAVDEEGLAELVTSIRDLGMLQPIRVRRAGTRFQVVAGERRRRAAVEAGLRRVPAIVVEATDAEALVEALVENVQREDLNALDRAHALQRLREVLELRSWEEVGRRIGISRVHVHRLLSVTTLPEPMREGVRSHGLNEKHARALVLLRADEESQRALWQRISEERLSGDAALREAKAMRSAGPDRSPERFEPPDVPAASARGAGVHALGRAAERLTQALAAAAPGELAPIRDQLAALRRMIDVALGDAPLAVVPPAGLLAPALQVVPVATM